MAFSRVFLIGFMCSGKSTLGRAVAQTLGWDFFDTDELIQTQEGMSVAEIFQEKGEDYFRMRELEVLQALCGMDKVVVSTGGGLGANPKALELMKSSGLVVWLRVDFETFLSRCGKDENRPLLKRGKEELRKIFDERSLMYAQAHVWLDALKRPEELVEELRSIFINYAGG